MNKIAKVVVAAGVAGMMIVPLSACGVKADLDVSVANKTVEAQGRAYFTKAEVDKIDALMTLATAQNLVDAEALAPVKSLFADLQPAGLEEAPDLLTNDKLRGDSKLLTEGAPLTADMLAEAGVIFDDDKLVVSGFAVDQNEAMSLAGGLTGGGIDLGDMSGLGSVGDLVGISSVQDLLDQISYYKLSMNFDKKPVDSNGVISENTVTFTDKAATQYYVTFAEGVDEATEIAPVLKDKAYTKKQAVSFKTPGIIESFSVNGATAVPPTCIDSASGAIKTNSALLAKQGKNTVEAKLVGGYTQTFTYNYDSKKPTASVKAGKSYKKGTKVTVKDAQALKSVTLDGKKVKVSGKKAVTSKIKKAGSHKIVATDKAGNKLTVKFKIKKK